MVTYSMMVLALFAALGALFLPLRIFQRLSALIAVWAALSVGVYVANEIVKAVGRAVAAGAR